MEAQKLMAGVQAAAKKAGALMLSADRVRESVKAKSGHANFVTAYDRQVQALLFEELSALLPEAAPVPPDPGAKPMLEVDGIDDGAFVRELLQAIAEELR